MFPLLQTQYLHKTELYDMSKAQLLAELDVCMGGRVAEEIVFGTNKVTTGLFIYFLDTASFEGENLHVYNKFWSTVKCWYLKYHRYVQMSWNSQQMWSFLDVI